jgi:hypothetical protein
MERKTSRYVKFRTGVVNLVGSPVTISTLWGATAIAVAGGISEAIKRWDQPWRTLFWISFALLVISLAARLGLVIAAWFTRGRTDPTAGTKQTLTGRSGTFYDLDTAVPVMASGQPDIAESTPAHGSRVIESTPDELNELGNALRALSTDLISLFFDFQPTPAMTVAPEKEPELAERYHRDFAYRVVYLYEEARRRGFRDLEIERCYQIPSVSRLLAPLASRFGALAQRVLDVGGASG